MPLRSGRGYSSPSGPPSQPAVARPAEAPLPLTAELRTRLDETLRVNGTEIPESVDLNLSRQPALLSAAGRLTLLTCCGILALETGSIVESHTLRAAFFRLSKATHPDRASALQGHVTEAQMKMAAQKVNAAYSLLKELGNFTVPSRATGSAWGTQRRSEWKRRQESWQQPGWMEQQLEKRREQEQELRRQERERRHRRQQESQHDSVEEEQQDTQHQSAEEEPPPQSPPKPQSEQDPEEVAPSPPHAFSGYSQDELPWEFCDAEERKRRRQHTHEVLEGQRRRREQLHVGIDPRPR